MILALSLLMLVVLAFVAAPVLAAWSVAKTGRGPLVLAGLVALLAVAGRSPVLLVLALVLGVVPVVTGWARQTRLPRVPSGRGQRRERIDPSALPTPWARLMRDALAAREQFHVVLARAPHGAIREQLEGLTAEVDSAVRQAWDGARHGSDLERTGRQLGQAAGAARSRRALRGRFPGAAEDHRVTVARRSRDEAAGRLSARVAEERSQLEILVARLGEAAWSAAELSAVRTAPALESGRREDLADQLLDRLVALRSALADASTPTAGPP